MANLTASLAQDNYKSTLSQAYNGAVGTIYVKNTPTVTFPAGKKVFLTINPEKSNMQVVRVSARDSALKTITVDSIAVNKGSGSAYTQQPHAVGSKVVISTPYAVWEELDTVTTDKLDTNGGNGLYYASTAARDTALGANGVPTTDYRMVRAGSTFYNYNLGTAQWESVDTGTPTPTMTTTSLGTAELGTQAENTAGTASGSVGPLVITPDIMATTIQRGERLYAGASATANDTYVVTMTPALAAYTTGMQISFKTDVANTGACTINVNGLGAKNIKTLAGSDPVTGEIPATTIVGLQYDGTNMVIQNPPVLATDAEAITGTDIKKVTTPYQLKTFTKIVLSNLTRDRNGANGTVTYTHNLGRTPRIVKVTARLDSGTYKSIGYYQDGTSYCIYDNGTSGGTQTFAIDVSYTAGGGQKGVIQNLTSTQFDIVWTKAGASAGTINCLVECS